MKMTKKLLYTLALLLVSQSAFAQNGIDQMMKYRNEPKGNIQYRKEGILQGNLVRTLFQNQGEVGHWPNSPSGEWPKGSGIDNLDGVSVLVATEISTPDAPNKLSHPLQTAYREWMDSDPVTGDLWGFEPVPGYFFESPTGNTDSTSKSPAISSNQATWPLKWPRALPVEHPEDWDGYWYGYFGRGVKNADEETFFVMDDSKDGEWKRPPYNFYPIASDHSFGGIGLRVEVRGFQWSHVLAEDIIFWHYDIVNISDNNYEKTYFGFYTDIGSGGKNSQDDNAFYDKKLDIAYGWDAVGTLTNGKKIGYYGYAYLESPGNSFDQVDNDEDGLIDEKRDSGPGELVTSPVDKSGVPKLHWSGDENGNWISYVDLNNNGKWDKSEPLNDDVGKDGLGPFDMDYKGPDEGEGDGKPTDGEPHFDKTDKNESDQIGLTALDIYVLGDGGVGGGWPKDDEQMWQRMSSGTFKTEIQKKNISMVFASGPFPLRQALRERFSMALVFGSDLQDLLFNKETVQQIYNANYNFSKPPLKPNVTAVAGDGKVFLFWDSKAEESRDPFLGYEKGKPELGYKKDFEGYMIYRSTEPEFQDIKLITDSKGAPKYWKPIAQFDLIDSIKGPDPVGINGASFFRGENSGLQHSYVDKDVKNGIRYYYAVVSYDMGDPKFGTAGLQPTECTKIIAQDFAGNVNFVDINCAVVTPNAPVAGYTPPQIVGNLKKVSEGVGTGKISVDVLSPNSIHDNVSYKIKFNSTGIMPKYKTSSFDVIRTDGSKVDTIVVAQDTSHIGAGKSSLPFDGMTVSVENDSIAIVDSLTNWLVGKSNLIRAYADRDLKYGVKWPNDYQLEFLPAKSVPSISATLPYDGPKVNFIATNIATGDTVPVIVFDLDNNGEFNVGDDFALVEFVDKNNNGKNEFSERNFAWHFTYRPLFGDAAEPQAGDKFILTTSKPFKQGDAFTYTTKASAVDNQLAANQLDRISVVPNPYISAASWEPKTLNLNGRGERRIEFIHLPAKCTIRIYTVAGALVKTLQKDSAPSDGSVFWNLVSEDGMDIAYGLYIYHVDAPGIGERIGKFAVIK